MLLPNTGRANRTVAALVSGGLDSAVMTALLARRYDRVHPLYLRCGLSWEDAERHFLDRFLQEVDDSRIDAVQELAFDMRDLLQDHWSASGQDIPGYHQPDEAWEIPGRNMILTAKAAVWCCLNEVDILAHGTLRGNPFPDATPQFFQVMEAALSQGLGYALSIERPLGGMSKRQVIEAGRDLPLAWTLSCASSVEERHCGKCGKCRERRRAFAASAVEDPTPYDVLVED